MKVEVSNIPKDKFPKVQSEILKVLIKNGFESIETIGIVDGITESLEGIELEIQIDKRKIPSIVPISTGA